MWESHDSAHTAMSPGVWVVVSLVERAMSYAWVLSQSLALLIYVKDEDDDDDDDTTVHITAANSWGLCCLYTRHSAFSFTENIWFSPYNNLPHFIDDEKGSEMQNCFAKITQLVSGRAEFELRSVWH